VIQTRGDHLADLGETIEDDAVDRREDRAAIQIHLRVLDRGLGRLQLCVGLRELRLRLIELLLGNEVLCAEFADTVGVEARERVVGLRRGEIRVGLTLARKVSGGVDPREHVALVHLLVVIDENLGDLPGNLRAHVDARRRLEHARGGDHLKNIAAGDGGGADFGRLFVAAFPEVVSAHGDRRDEDE
jgi:hypothetical protein